MSRPRRPWLAALAVALAGCAHHRPAPAEAMPAPSPIITMPVPSAFPPGHPGRPAGGLPDPARVDRRDPDAVSAAALAATWASDTAIDVSPHDAALRAAPYLTANYLARLQATPPRAAPGAAWASWAAHRAHIHVALRELREDPPVDTASLARRQWAVTTTPLGRDGWRGPTATTVCFLTLTFERGSWRVAAITVA